MRMTISHPTHIRKPRPTNVSLDGALLDEAKALKINISQACEAGLAQHLKKARAEKWLADNREAIAESNAYVEKFGLPLEKYRQF
jgi:antitoxin CcdA